MSFNNISDAVRGKISAAKGINVARISADNHIRQELGVTSMEYIAILTDIAASLCIDLMMFSEQEIISAHTVGDLERVIASKGIIKDKV